MAEITLKNVLIISKSGQDFRKKRQAESKQNKSTKNYRDIAESIILFHVDRDKKLLRSKTGAE